MSNSESKSDTAVALVVVFIIVAAFVWAYSDSLPFRSEVTVYNMFCTGGLKVGECNSEEQTANPATYKAIVEQQTIIYWHGDDGVPQRLRHCAVRDARNWSCQLGNTLSDNPDIEWQMVDGKFSEVAKQPHAISSNFYHVPKWHWWWVRIGKLQK